MTAPLARRRGARAAAAAGLACALAAGAARAQPARALDDEVPGEPGRRRTVAPARSSDDAAAAAPGEARVAVWLQPLWSVVGPLLGNYLRFYTVYGGVNASLGRGLDLVVEGGVVHSARSGQVRWSGALAVGTAILLTGDRRLNGLFIQPKVLLQYGQLPNTFDGSWLTLALGLDVGAQWTFGPLFIAPVLGIAPGLRIPTGADSRNRSVQYVPVTNYALLRIGLAF